MAVVDGSGVASGSSTASLSGSVVFHQSGVASGTSTATANGGVLYLSTGRALGTSELLWDYIQDASGTVSGTSTMTGDAVRVRTAKGVALGSSSLLTSIPLPMLGTSFMSAAPVVDRIARAITMGPKTFQWFQLLQRGDLSIFICERDGGIVVPLVIVYSLYLVRPDGSRKPVAAQQNRRPVAGTPGEFYVTGRAGEGGQPGNWLIEWQIQKGPQYPLQVVEMPFRVLDSVLLQSPTDLTPRRVKFGWN